MYILAVHPEGDYFKVALLSYERKRVKIRFIQEFKKDASDLILLKKKIDKEIFYKKEALRIASLLNADDVFVRKLVLPITKTSLLKKALPFQLEGLIPFEKESRVTIPVIKKGKKESSLTIYSYTEETLKKHLSEIEEIGFTSDFVFSVPIALLRFYKIFVKGGQNTLLVHFGWETTTLLAIEKGDISRTISLPFGLKQVIDSVKQDMPDREELHFSYLESLLQSALLYPDRGQCLEKELVSFQRELYRALAFFGRKEGFTGFDGVLYTGYASCIRRILETVPEAPKNEVEILPHLEYSKEDLLSYAIEIGLGIEALEEKSDGVQFLIGPHLAQKQKELAKKKLTFVGASVFLAIATVFISSALFFQGKIERSKEKFYEMVSLANDSLEEYPEVKEGTVSGLRKAVYRFSKKHQKGENLQIPRSVSCFMNVLWPSLKEPIVLEEFHYAPVEKGSFCITLHLFSKDAEAIEALCQNLINSKLVASHTVTRENDEYQLVFYLDK